MNRTGILHSIYTKLFLAILIVVTPICLVSLEMNKYGEKNVREITVESIKSRTNFYSRLLENEFARIVMMQEEYVNDPILQRLISREPILGEIERYESILSIHNQMKKMANASPYIESATVYIPSLDRQISDSAMLAKIPENEYLALKSVTNRYENPFIYWDDRLFISFPYYRVSWTQNREPQFVIGVEINVREVKQVLDQFAINGVGGSMIMGPAGQWIISSNTGSLSTEQMRSALASDGLEEFQTVKELQFPDGVYWLVTENNPEYEVSLVTYMPESEFVGPLALYRTWYWVMISIALLVLVFFAYWLFWQIHRPMGILMRAFREVKRGNFEIKLSHKRRDEFDYVYVNFNAMVSQINELINEVYEQKFRANLSELRQLQSQINPHFLYNSFFILYRMAENEEIENVAQFTSYLGRYFHFLTRTQNGAVRLAEEVEFSRTYVDIQKFRFEDRIDVNFEQLPQMYENVEVPRLILQPLVENAYEHGLKNIEQDGLLEIRFECRDNCLVITVEDNGMEMPEDEFVNLIDKLSATEKMDVETTGLINVHRRLRLQFGEQAGVTFNRRPEGGNQVLLKLPVASNDLL